MELDTVDVLNVHRQAALAVNFRENGRVYNTGFCKIPQKKGASYRFYMFAKADQSTKLLISITEGERKYSGAEVTVSGNEYSFYEAVLVANGDTQNAKFEICCPSGGMVKFGFVSLMPMDTYLGHGLRKDIVEKLKAMNPKFFRFPGGCIVEGFSPSTAMRFRNTVGPVWERPGHQLMWHYRTYNGLGFTNIYSFARI
jgi:hypothetical protein